MQVYNNNIKNPSFGLIKLEPKDLDKSKQLLQNIAVPNLIKAKKDAFSVKLYNIFEPYLAKEAKNKAKKSYILEDVISDLKIKFWEIIQGVNSNTCIDNIIEEIDTYKTSKNILKPGYTNKSIDAPILDKETLCKSQFVTKKNLPVPQSGDKINNIKQTLKDTIENSTLTEKGKNRLTKKSSGLTYESIAKEEKNAYSTIYISVKSNLLKLQKANNTISKENKEQITELAKILGISFEQALCAAIKAANILSFPLDKLENNLEKAVKLFGIPKNDFVKILIKQPQLFLMNPETIYKKIESSANIFEISKGDFIQAALKHPSLFCQSSESLNKNVEASANLFKISKNDFINLALKNPVLFLLKSETIQKKSKIIAYYKKIQNKEEKINILSCMRSADTHYKNILNYLVRKNVNKNLLKEKMKLPEILKTSTNIIKLEIPKDEVSEDFIKFAENYSVKNTGKNIFEFKIIEE